MFKLKSLGYLNPRFVRLSAISHLKKELNQYELRCLLIFMYQVKIKYI